MRRYEEGRNAHSGEDDGGMAYVYAQGSGREGAWDYA